MSRHGSLVIVGFFVMFMFIGQILAQQQAIALHEADVGSGPSLVRPEAEESFSHSQDENSDSLIWDTVGSPSTLDPHRCYEGFGNWISENVYETLFTYPFDSPDTTTLIPLLAESVDISTDGLDYTFTLRQGVTFHDGTSFNASCVKDNFERLLKIFDTNGPAWMIAERLLGGQAVEDAAFTFGPGSQEHIDAYDAWTEMGSILVLSEYVVKMRLAAPYAGFLQCLACQEAAMISPTWFEAHGPVGYGEFNEYVDSHTCGTGPYMVDEWVVGGHITLTKNPDYWRESLALQTYPEAGSIHTVVIRTVEDFEERKLNVLSGQSDGCHWPRANALEIWDPVGGQSLDPDISVYTGEPSYTTMALAINLHDQYNLSGVFVENPFASKDLREACSYAFDYASFIDSAWQGQALRGQGPLPSGMFGHDDNLFMYDLDLQLAVDAWNRAMESGLDTALAESFYCLNLYYTVRDEATRVLREDSLSLFKAGIEAILSHPDAVQPSQPLDIQVFELELADYLAYRGYESHLVMLVGWAPDYADPDNYLFPFCHSQGVYSWWIGYGDSQVDEWIDSSRGESDTVIRIQQIHQIQQAIVDAAAYIWLGQPTSFEVMRADVQGYSYNPMRYQPSGYSGGGAYFYHMWLIGRSLEPEPSSDTIVWETAGNPDTLDPHRNYGAFGIGITNNVYETLFTYAFDSADTSTLVPLLAESADISSDGYEYTITLREGVAFHDGTPFNASCVKYNLERAMKIFDPAGPAWELGETLLGAISVQNAVFSYGQGSQEHIDAYETWVGSESIAILDTYMVRIRLERPFAPFLHVLAFPVCSMISPTWVERHGGVQHGQSSGFVDARTCGTGPYCVTECLYNDHITLTRNPDYWRASEVHALKPNAGSIQTVVLWNNDDAASREARLLSGRIDGCFWPRDDALQIWDPVTRQSLDPDVNVWTEDLTYTMFALGFNMREYIQSFGFARQNPFYSRDLRAACSYAFDYALFIDTTFHGLAIQGKGPIPAGMYGHDNNLFMYHNDIQLAVESWNQAMASGLDSVLADNSYELNLYCHPDSAFQVQALNVFKAGLDAILAHEDAVQPSQELTIQIIGLDWSEYDSLRRNGGLLVTPTGWAPDYADPDNYLYPFCYSTGPWAGWIGYDDPQVKTWFEASRGEMDPEERLQLIHQIQQAVVEDTVYIWLGQFSSFHVERSTLYGYVFNPMRSISGFADVILPYFYDYWKEPQTPTEAIETAIAELEDIIYENPDTPLEEEMEDVLAEAEIAFAELSKTPPDNQAGIGNIERAVSDLEAAMEGGLIDPTQGAQLLDAFVAVARQIAVHALIQAIAADGDEDLVDEALQYLYEGDTLWSSGYYKDAVDKYKDSLCQSESVLS